MRFAKLASVLCLGSSAMALSLGAIAQQTAPAEPKSAVPVCAGCHEQPHASIAMTAHGAKNDATAAMCQACHGDATEHLKDPAKSKPANPSIKSGNGRREDGRVPRLPRDAIGNSPSGNRASTRKQRRRVRELPQHPRQGRATRPIAPFTDHLPSQRSGRLRHVPPADPLGDMKPSHHPIIESKIKCSDCHNPHGAISPVMLRNAVGQRRSALRATPTSAARSCSRTRRSRRTALTLPQPARLLALQAPERARAEPVPGLPRRGPASRDVSTAAARPGSFRTDQPNCERQHALHRAGMPELPQRDPRLERARQQAAASSCDEARRTT